MHALVTGGTSGIGKAIAIALAGDGYNVTAIGRQAGELEALRREYGITGLAADITDHGRIAEAIAGLQIDVLVNNAGIMPPLGNFCDADAGDIDRAIAVNFSSVLNVTRLIAPSMRARRRGHIFFTGSTAGHAPFPNLAIYCATKAAVGAFAHALRLDLSPYQVRVTEIVAGRVETGLYRDVASAGDRAAMYANHSAVQPGDIAAMVLSVLKLPSYVDVSRFDILPTYQATATGAARKES